MSSVPAEWVPAGSVPYDTSLADEGHAAASGALEDGSIAAFFSTGPYHPPKALKVRDPRHCIRNDNTCMGWKSADTDFCAGHRKADAKASAITDSPTTEVAV